MSHNGTEDSKALTAAPGKQSRAQSDTERDDSDDSRQITTPPAFNLNGVQHSVIKRSRANLNALRKAYNSKVSTASVSPNQPAGKRRWHSDDAAVKGLPIHTAETSFVFQPRFNESEVEGRTAESRCNVTERKLNKKRARREKRRLKRLQQGFQSHGNCQENGARDGAAEAQISGKNSRQSDLEPRASSSKHDHIGSTTCIQPLTETLSGPGLKVTRRWMGHESGTKVIR